jgi:L-glyceraldehyde 3-phosphate reductase
VLRNPVITSALIGASKVSQIQENVAAVRNTQFSAAELSEIDRIVEGQ